MNFNDFGAAIVWDDNEEAARNFGTWTNKKQLKYLMDEYQLDKDKIKVGDYVQFSTFRSNDVYWIVDRKKFIKNVGEGLTVPCEITKHIQNPVKFYSDFSEDVRPEYICLSSNDPFVVDSFGGTLPKSFTIMWSFFDKKMLVEKIGSFKQLYLLPGEMNVNEISHYFSSSLKKSSKSSKSPKSPKSKKCKGTKVVNPRTNRCWKSCPKHLIKNPKTYKCIKLKIK